jgi:hypothetical protein
MRFNLSRSGFDLYCGSRRFEVNHDSFIHVDFDVAEFRGMEPVTKIVSYDFHEREVGFFGVLGLSFRDVETYEEVTDHGEVLDIMYVELLELERPLIFFREKSSMDFISMFVEAGPGQSGKHQKLVVNLIIDDISNFDQEDDKSKFKR